MDIQYDENWNIIDPDANTDEIIKVVDANGIELLSGDSIIAIKPLPVKNGVNIAKGDKFIKIRLTDDPEVITAKHPKNGEMYLRTEFFRKI